MTQTQAAIAEEIFEQNPGWLTIRMWVKQGERVPPKCVVIYRKECYAAEAAHEYQIFLLANRELANITEAIYLPRPIHIG